MVLPDDLKMEELYLQQQRFSHKQRIHVPVGTIYKVLLFVRVSLMGCGLDMILSVASKQVVSMAGV